MKKVFYAAAMCCLVAMSATFVGCKDKNSPEEETSAQPQFVKSVVSYQVFLTFDLVKNIAASLDEVALTIHYTDASGAEKTQAVTKDGETVTVTYEKFPAEFKAYVTGELKDKSKDKYTFGLMYKGQVQNYMSDGSKGIGYTPTELGFGAKSIAKDVIETEYLQKLPTFTTFKVNIAENGDISK